MNFWIDPKLIEHFNVVIKFYEEKMAKASPKQNTIIQIAPGVLIPYDLSLLYRTYEEFTN